MCWAVFIVHYYAGNQIYILFKTAKKFNSCPSSMFHETRNYMFESFTP